MIVMPDVNVLAAAWWPSRPTHMAARRWLESQIDTRTPLGLSELVLSGTVRQLTHPRIPSAGYEAGQVLALADELLGSPGVVPVRQGPRHWAIFCRLVLVTGARGNEVPDCYHAAAALEIDAVWASTDRFFEQVPGLRLVNPFT